MWQAEGGTGTGNTAAEEGVGAMEGGGQQAVWRVTRLLQRLLKIAPDLR